ncbi:MAG: encapsulin-associated ferritin-like protein [Candidatus Bipolaricaulota bacterium]
MTQYHEPVDELEAKDRDIVRTLMSLKEEVEAVNWYQQRASASDNEELANLLAHNRDEEIEHACMAIEWLRRNMPGWDEELQTYLFSEEPITQLEELEEDEELAGDEESAEDDGPADLGLGSL